MYPQMVQKIYKAGMRRYNDPDKGVYKIKPYPEEYLERPKPAPSVSQSLRKALSTEEILAFAEADLSKGRDGSWEWVQSVCMLSFCLGGMNVADMYDLRPEDYDGERIKYYRSKTKGKRLDGAYMEVKVQPEARPYLDILMAGAADGKLLNISAHYAVRSEVHRYLAKVLGTISRATGLPRMTVYSFRYSFASIEVNECNIHLDDVAFAMNHATAHRVTEGYVKKDFSRVDGVIGSVLAMVFGF